MQHGGYVCFPGDLQKVGITSFKLLLFTCFRVKRIHTWPWSSCFLNISTPVTVVFKLGPCSHNTNAKWLTSVTYSFMPLLNQKCKRLPPDPTSPHAVSQLQQPSLTCADRKPRFSHKMGFKIRNPPTVGNIVKHRFKTPINYHTRCKGPPQSYPYNGHWMSAEIRQWGLRSTVRLHLLPFEGQQLQPPLPL